MFPISSTPVTDKITVGFSNADEVAQNMAHDAQRRS